VRRLLPLLLLLIPACYTSFEEQKGTTPRPAEKAAPKPASPPKKAPPKKKKPAQSYREAWRLICNAETLSGADRLQGRARESRVASWIVEHLENKEARYWFIALGQLKPEQRPMHFRIEANKAGQRDCASAAILFPTSAPGEAAPAANGGPG